jgi:ribosome biogenesis GTPase A
MHDALAEADPPETDEALRAYVKARDAVVDLLRDLREALEPVSGDASGTEPLLARLAEDRFNLVVLGEWKRGKSSLVNAILGRALLPTAAVPLTSVVTAVSHGPVERAFILRFGARFPERIPVDALRDFVTERGNPHNMKGVASAQVEAPAAFLKHGLHLVDTPGVASVHSESEAVTRAFLPEADAAVFVTSAEAPLSRSELGFLDTVRSSVRKVFFVVNKIDLVDRREQPELVRFIETTLANRLGIHKPLVFPLSTRTALEAKVSGSAAFLAASGLPALESALAEFLGRERRQVFLAAILDRALRLVDAERFALELRRQHAGDEAAKTELARRLEAVESARQDAVRAAEAERAEWERQVLEPALGRFTDSAVDSLRRSLPGVGGFGRLDADSYAERLARWCRQSLAERAVSWEAEHRASIDSAAKGLCDPLAATLLAIVAGVGRAAAETLAVTPPAGAAADDVPWIRPPAAFEPAPAEALVAPESAAAIPVYLPGPAPLGRRLARWLAARDLPVQVNDAAARLRERVHGHLVACLRIVEAASAEAIEREEERLGLTRSGERWCADRLLPEEQVAGLDRLAQRIARLREAVLGGGAIAAETSGRAEPAGQGTPGQAGRELPAVRPRKDWTRLRTCPVCAHVLDALFDFLSQFQYALATDPATQASFREAGGFCALHAWQLQELSSPRGLSAGYPALLEGTAEKLRALAPRAPAEAARSVRGMMVTAGAGCVACRARGDAEEEAVRALCDDLSTEAGRARQERSHGLCLRHLGLVLSRVTASAAGFLLRHQSRRCVEVAEGLAGYALKFDAHRQDLLSGDEAGAYREAVVLIAGERRVF